MAPGVNSLLVCLFVVLLSHSQGLQFTLDSTPDTFYCGHIDCSVNVNQNDALISSVIGLSISSIVESNTLIRLASLTVFDPVPHLEPTTIHDLNVTGSISRYHGNLALALRNETYCFGSFLCELDYVNVTGQPDVIRKAVSSVDTENCTDILYQLTKMTEKLETHSDDVDRQLAELNSQNTVMLVKQTDMDGRLTEFRTDMDGQLGDLKTQNTVMEQELVKLKDQNVAMGTKLDSVLGYISRLEGMINSSLHVNSTVSCFRGEPYNQPREKFLLWGRVPALCDTETDGGGWVIIQRRTKGDEDFYRGWEDYKKGFGTPYADYWIGNDNIHDLTSQGYSNLRVDMEYQGVKYFAEYSNFSVADEVSKYKMTVGGYHGNATDDLNYHSGMYFSTFDRDNDQHNDLNCAATLYHGGWWYNACSFSNLNGLWGAQNVSGLFWGSVVYPGSVTWSEMKVRQV